MVRNLLSVAQCVYLHVLSPPVWKHTSSSRLGPGHTAGRPAPTPPQGSRWAGSSLLGAPDKKHDPDWRSAIGHLSPGPAGPLPYLPACGACGAPAGAGPWESSLPCLLGHQSMDIYCTMCWCVQVYNHLILWFLSLHVFLVSCLLLKWPFSILFIVSVLPVVILEITACMLNYFCVSNIRRCDGRRITKQFEFTEGILFREFLLWHTTLPLWGRHFCEISLPGIAVLHNCWFVFIL